MTTTSFSLAPVIPQGRSRGSRTTSGGIALPPESDSGKIRLLTYNTSEDPHADNNLSHAERQFEEFLERAPRIADNVKEIQADINLSPCRICSGTLSHVTRLTRRASRRTLHWHDVYRHPTRGTTDSSLGSISGWDVTPTSVSLPPENLSEFDAAEWAAMG